MPDLKERIIVESNKVLARGVKKILMTSPAVLLALTSCKFSESTKEPIKPIDTAWPKVSEMASLPTFTPEPTPSLPILEVDGLKIPDPKASNPEFFNLTSPDSPIVQFANAFGIKPEEVGNLTPKLLTSVDGKQFVVLTTGNLTTTATFDETDTPLFIAEQGENGEWVWENATLKRLADRAGILIRSEFPWLVFYDPHLKGLFFDEVNGATIDYGVYWSNVEPQKGVFRFSIMDTQIKEAQKYGLSLRGHALLFPTSSVAVPDWLKSGTFSKEELTQVLINHVKQVVSHGKQQGINEWVVVNEPYLPKYREDDMFYKIFGGYDYIEIAFQAAREADPSATLIYNDSDNHDSGGLTTSLTCQIIERLKSKDLVDAVGVQAHLDDWVGVPDSNDVRNTLRNYGLPVIVTEFDYNLEGVSGSQQERYLKQANVYEDFFRAAIEAEVTDFTFWGIDDKNSWLEKDFSQSDSDPTLFSDNYQPKPAYYAILQALFDYLIIQNNHSLS